MSKRAAKATVNATSEPPLKSARTEPVEAEPPSKMPFPFSDLTSVATLAETLRPEVGAVSRTNALLAWFIAISESQVNPAPQTSKWFLPLKGWEIAQANGPEIIAVRNGPVTCHPNDVATITGLVVRGFSTRLKVGNERMYLPTYATTVGHASFSHTTFKFDPFQGKDLAWLGTLFDWLCQLNPTTLIPALPSIATAAIRVASRTTPAFAVRIEEILSHGDHTVVLNNLTQEIEHYGPSESVFAPFLVCLRIPLLEDLSTSGKWDIVRDSRYRGVSAAMMIELVTSLKVLPPTPTSVMRGYCDERGEPFPVKNLRECLESDFVPCGPRVTTGQSLVSVLNDEAFQVSVLPSPETVLYVKAPRTNVLSRKGPADSLGLELVRGDILASAANPRPPVAATNTPDSSGVTPVVPMTFEL